MSVKHADQPDIEMGNFHIQIAERDGHQYVVISEQHPTDKPGEQAVAIPLTLLPEIKRAFAEIEETVEELPTEETSVRFAHASEEEFARILDFYHIRWEYEPRTFAIEWDEAGNAVSSFAPDFYLPDHDLYIELTTLKQSLVTKKNRKVRRLRELYPDINIKLLYASDFSKLIKKFAASKYRKSDGG
ncbi:MAG: hypothetical protein AB1631_32945 [Acidobacteriota bacterium]